MPRVARTVFADLPHHITQRGNTRETVFFNDEDRICYLSWPKEYGDKQNIEILPYSLMTNHVRLVACAWSQFHFQKKVYIKMKGSNLLLFVAAAYKYLEKGDYSFVIVIV